jgi:hypothetical protein
LARARAHEKDIWNRHASERQLQRALLSLLFCLSFSSQAAASGGVPVGACMHHDANEARAARAQIALLMTTEITTDFL